MKKIILIISLFIGCSKTPTDVPIDSQNNVEAIVTFSVNMSFQIESENFEISSDFLDIAGDFNTWNGGADYHLILTNNNLYEISFSTFEVGQEIQFKFRINGVDWETPNRDVCNCIVDSDGYVNRVYTIQAGQNILPTFWYNDEEGS